MTLLDRGILGILRDKDMHNIAKRKGVEGSLYDQIRSISLISHINSPNSTRYAGDTDEKGGHFGHFAGGLML